MWKKCGIINKTSIMPNAIPKITPRRTLLKMLAPFFHVSETNVFSPSFK
jgi:hypothetical protein